MSQRSDQVAYLEFYWDAVFAPRKSPSKCGRPFPKWTLLRVDARVQWLVYKEIKTLRDALFTRLFTSETLKVYLLYSSKLTFLFSPRQTQKRKRQLTPHVYNQGSTHWFTQCPQSMSLVQTRKRVRYSYRVFFTNNRHIVICHFNN